MGLRAPFQPQARAAALSRGNVGFSPAVASSPWLAQPWLRNHGCAGRGGLCPQAGPPTAACWPSLQPELASWPRVDSFAPSGPLPVTPGLVYPGDSLSGWVSTGGRGVPTPLSPEASSRAALPACLPATLPGSHSWSCWSSPRVSGCPLQAAPRWATAPGPTVQDGWGRVKQGMGEEGSWARAGLTGEVGTSPLGASQREWGSPSRTCVGQGVPPILAESPTTFLLAWCCEGADE